MVKVVITMVIVLSTLTRGSVCSVSETMWHTAHSSFKSLADDAHSYLISLLGKNSVDTLLKTVKDAIKVTSHAAAQALNVVASYITDFLGAAGIDAKLPVKYFTPEGVVFVVQWALLAVLGYWLLSLAVCLIAGVVRRTLFLLKVIVAVAVFGLIVSDGGASAETTAMRLAGLVLACVLLGIGPSYFRGDANAHLEKKIKLLEKRLREVERKRKEE
ncbi:transmembrane protein 109 [Tachysurus vachellii]|uniref:transmembrane protein 109 n=1 Tax=Tachysurus vachellii TaxID=175792 RepID=UPI00296ABB29|nr:transmembrane protein 109 [Tachysurus vachellii]